MDEYSGNQQLFIKRLKFLIRYAWRKFRAEITSEIILRTKKSLLNATFPIQHVNLLKYWSICHNYQINKVVNKITPVYK